MASAALPPAVESLVRLASQLSRLAPPASRYVRTDGVVPMTNRKALAWVAENSLEQLSRDGIELKVGVADERGQVRAVCIGATAEVLDAPLELTPIAPHAHVESFQTALRAGAQAALAMGYPEVLYYRPVGDEPGDPFKGFAPLPDRAFRSAKGGGLPWKMVGSDYFQPWLRTHDPERFRELKADELRAAQVDAILAWEDAEQELLEAKHYAPSDRDYERLAENFGFDYYEDWRPAEMSREDAYQFLDSEVMFECYALAAERAKGPLRVVPMSLSNANAVVTSWHSHLQRPTQGHLFSLGVVANASPDYPQHLRAVAIVSLPRSRAIMQQGAVEVVRVAVGSGLPPLHGVDPRHKGSEASFVLKRCVDAAYALGYSRVVSTTLLGEAGAGYRGAGWTPVAVSMGGHWGRSARGRDEAEQPGIKVRWEAGPGAVDPVSLTDKYSVDRLVREAHALAREGLMPLGGP